MICDHCGKNEARLRLRPECYRKGNELFIIEDVPIICCRNCGQDYLTAETVHKLDAIRADPGKFEMRSVLVAQFPPA